MKTSLCVLTIITIAMVYAGIHGGPLGVVAGAIIGAIVVTALAGLLDRRRRW